MFFELGFSHDDLPRQARDNHTRKHQRKRRFSHREKRRRVNIHDPKPGGEVLVHEGRPVLGDADHPRDPGAALRTRPCSNAVFQRFSVYECLSRACLGKSIVSFPVRKSRASQKRQRLGTSEASVVLNDRRLLPRIGAIKGEQPVPGTVGIHRCRQQTAPLFLSFS
jgi:hypothetical protein